jgi:hypothetical protein
MLVAGGFGSEAQAIVIDLKSKKWEPTPEPMKQPRREVTKLEVRIKVAIVYS